MTTTTTTVRTPVTAVQAVIEKQLAGRDWKVAIRRLAGQNAAKKVAGAVQAAKAEAERQERLAAILAEAALLR